MHFTRTNFSTAALRHDRRTELPEGRAQDASLDQTQAGSAGFSRRQEAPVPLAVTGGTMGNFGRGGIGSTRKGVDATPPAKSSQAGSERPFEDEPWQNHFYLAPNVRFTRTPEREFMKRRSPSEEQKETASGPQEAAGRREEGRPTAETAVSEMAARTGRQVESAGLPTIPYPFGSVLHLGLDAQMAEAPVAAGYISTKTDPGTSGVRAAERQAEPAGKAGAAREAGPLSYLSDHAFFDLMPLTVQEAPVPAPVAHPSRAEEWPRAALPASLSAPAAPAPAKAAMAIPSTEVTNRFRIIECRTAVDAEPQEMEDARPTRVPADEPSQAGEDMPQRERAEVAPANDDRHVAPAGKVLAFSPPPASRSPLAVSATRRPAADGSYEFPSADLLQNPPEGQGFYMTQEQIEQNAGLLENVLEDFGVRGEIIHVRPGPVVTLYEFEPAPGVKSSRVINLADDIARSMSAVSARVAVVPGRNVIGIELPNASRETVYLRELIQANDFRRTGYKLALCLGKTIGGEAVIAELAKMPHLLVAGTTGSGKSVAINTMILSLLYRLRPEECRLIMVDPKMLELSVYDGIPHLLTPVVTDPKKAVTALKWAVREMEDRYRKMARLGVRNIDGYNQRAASARDKGEPVLISVQTGFDRSTGEPVYEEQEMDLAPMPYIVVIVDEMADLMMVAGKEIEGAIQRLAQMARAAGIHLIMATQRPSVDVITGTIKANFPTRISFQVTSKIDSRTILGEQGAEQLLGQGDMLHMSGGGRIVRVHGPFVSDEEVEQVVAHLKTQGRPEYLETVTADEEEEQAPEEDGAIFDKGAIASEDGNDLYDKAVKVVLRDKRCSTSYIQRRLGIGYNRAASLIERMEQEGLVGKPNHVGKREILIGSRDVAAPPSDDMD
ncbi:DNA translocase FtsK [Chelativorans sp. AA-79]|uniref:DNA translocase FtsK n=1 Tax=Chelativorans sp. AA-79 TaxID=3028735 RepID=UPI0023F7AEFC|nr:DNA translocase FtsK [Chelativorans sp. AA-79]WEX07350.1 DNA translocase FtsK [Chelativorans sp. AA-79]